jgi:hypothetical protein
MCSADLHIISHKIYMIVYILKVSPIVSGLANASRSLVTSDRQCITPSEVRLLSYTWSSVPSSPTGFWGGSLPMLLVKQSLPWHCFDRVCMNSVFTGGRKIISVKSPREQRNHGLKYESDCIIIGIGIKI